MAFDWLAYIKRTAVRRVVLIVVGTLVYAALAAFSPAQAQTSPCLGGDAGGSAQDGRCTIEEAYAQTKAIADSYLGNPAPGCSTVIVDTRVRHDALNLNFYAEAQCQGSVGWANYAHRTYLQGCPADKPWNHQTGTCGNNCDSKPPLSPGHVKCYTNDINNCPLTVCVDGCAYEDHASTGSTFYSIVVDGERYIATDGWLASGGSCTVGHDTPDLTTPPTDSDGDGTSDGNDPAPHNPGIGGQGDDGPSPTDDGGLCGRPGQPECGPASPNRSGGGGDCSTPPTSEGDAILAQIAYQTWATRCALQGSGNGNNPGQGDGDGDGHGDGPGAGPDVPVDDTDYITGSRRFGIPVGTGLLNTENIFGTSSCPQLPSFAVMSVTVDLSGFAFWCDLVAVLRAVILIFGAFTAVRILMGGV